MQVLIRLLIPVILLLGGWFGYGILSKQKEKVKHPEPEGRVLKTQVFELHVSEFQTKVRTQGVVRAANEASLTAEVAGKVKMIAPGLQDGVFFDADELLVELEDQDYQTIVISAEAQLARANALLAQEQARARQARLNWEDLGYTEEPNELVLRLPQLREAEANVKAAEAGLEQAKRDLERTKIHAPFAGRVLQRNVSMGQLISAGTPLALIFNTDYVEVRLPIAATELPFLTIPESRDEAPVTVKLFDALNTSSEFEWTGEIVGTEGALDTDSRELFAIARVMDPFSRNGDADHRRPPLRIGQPVRAEIPGRILKNVIAIPRSSVRQLNRIYLVDKKEMVLSRQEIVPIWSDEEFHVISPTEEIVDGALLATTRLAYAPNVSKVEILPPDPEVPLDTDETPKAEKDT